MSSDLASSVRMQLTGNAMSLGLVAIIVYDYILTFPREVEYIWIQPWTRVSVLFFVIRYVGIYTAMTISLLGSSFVPGPLKMCMGYIYSLECAQVVFAAASDLVMVLRVYALWNRSKIILSILLICYAIRIIILFVAKVVLGNPRNIKVSIYKLLDYSVCYGDLSVPDRYMTYRTVTSSILYVLLLVLALVPTLRQSIAMYKGTKRWQPNQYMSLIVREGVFYLLLNSINNAATVIVQASKSPLSPTSQSILVFFSIATLYPIIPRFVLSIRELYARDGRGRREPMDSRFGITSRARNVAGWDSVVVSAIAFADRENPSNGGIGEDDDKIHIELVGRRNERQEDCSA